MIEQNKNDNAANRKSYVGAVYNVGEKSVKENVLRSLRKDLAALHEQGYIHIHDLDAYGLSYNCLTFDILKGFPYKRFEDLEDAEKIIGVFDFLKELFEKMGNEQSGGMALANFDNDFAEIFTKLKVNYSHNESVFRAAVRSVVVWCNNNHTRMGQTSYYVTFNIGLAKNDFARFLAYTLLDEFEKSGPLVYKPNIIFKVHEGVNRRPYDSNFDLLKKALLCTAKKMIPTYLLCDCEGNRNVPPERLSVMGCRTRVVDDLYGETGAIGRGNICNISVNLPKLALEAAEENPGAECDNLMGRVKEKWTKVAEDVSEILVDRYEKTCTNEGDLYATNCEYELWCRKFERGDLHKVFKHGTLSIGFIGLSEMIEIVTGEKYWNSKKNYDAALDFVRFMREFTDGMRDKTHLNFSLLATSGEYISGRFIDIDKMSFNHKVLNKGYYTNSFHVDVDSKMSAKEKIETEGPFHTLCNGGCISYIELSEAPIGNWEGMLELVEIAIASGVHYFGFNFPQDVCSRCNATGVFDVCPVCGNIDVTHIRRVSGYLEVFNFFTDGKKKECENRRGN